MQVDGPRIRRRRERNGQGLRAFASAVGVSPSHLSRIERGERAPQPEVLVRIARGLNCPVEELEGAEGAHDERAQHRLAVHDDEGARGPRP
ncbi:helix-turn-helix domain-containing protein [Streptomyces sp. NBC_00582]|uniref:helix-turn-helix domain-containing protein n=1 Tax=Streptomyces sp. NBC_00582 TaxID=2975783 RepID=UPI003FCD8864